jgi:uncharacterized RmlC-like cupin family protein
MSEEPLGPVGDTIIFENEFVRVWGLSLDPDERQSWHVHELPYLVIPLTEGKNEMRWKDGRVVHTNEFPGQALWRMPGAAHELVNTSGWTYRNILIELKAAAGGASA